MYLEDLIDEIKYENIAFEAKAILNRDDPFSWLKTIDGFANASGGEFYIGVEDKTNKLIGFDRKEADTERNYFNNQVNEHIVPRPNMKITFLCYTVKEKDRFIIKVMVEESLLKPVILKYKGSPTIFMRREGFTSGATYEEIIDMSIKSRNSQYDTLISDVPYRKENFTDLFRFYKNHHNGSELKEKALASLGFMNKEGFLTNGALLFMDDYQEKKTTVKCSVFSGITKGSERIVSVNRFDGNITSSIDYMMNFIDMRMNHMIIKKEDSRVNIDAYPKRALFEGIVNAVVHRDYFIDGSQIQIDMFKDRLEISSPGGFYRGEKLEKTYDLSGLISKRRNEMIAGVLVLCNVMEAAGTGFDKIMEEYQNADAKHKPYVYSYSQQFTLVLPDLTYDDGVEDESVPSLCFVKVPDGTDIDGKVLSFCYRKAHKASEIAGYLGITDSTYFRKKILENLVKHGYLSVSKIGNAAAYQTKHDMVSLN